MYGLFNDFEYIYNTKLRLKNLNCVTKSNMRIVSILLDL